LRTGFAFDLDGTVTLEELLPLIARQASLEDEIGLLTRLTIDGTLSFAASFKLRFAILKSLPFAQVQAGVAAARLDPHIAAFIQARPDQCRIVTGNIPQWIGPLTDRLGCGVYSSEASASETHPLALTRIINKADAINTMRADFDRVVAIGEGANDIAMFDAADISIAYGGVHEPAPALLEVSDYVVYENGTLCRLLNMLS
jgi:HAD superfamily phosphoserine phosphatase-like hydrolase